MHWDIFCKVIDNHGDIGVCWRLASDLGSRGERVRLWVDDAAALAWMAPTGHDRVQVLPWAQQVRAAPADVVIEAFGCELDPRFQSELAVATKVRQHQPLWINLEYLTAESFAQRNHGLRSPVLSGPASGLTKYFFYPGFTSGTGGLLREPDLLRRQAEFDRAAWLRRRGIDAQPGVQLVSLFCYEPAGLPELLRALAAGPRRTHLIVTAGRATAAVRAASIPDGTSLSVSSLPLVPQHEFDQLLWACDLNFVRGEDSIVRALWAGRPFVWQLYPQDDDAHRAKLAAFLDWLEAPPSWRAFHRFWNGDLDPMPPLLLDEWVSCASAARDRLLMQQDLVPSLLRFVAEKM